MSESEQEKRNKRVAWITTTVINLVVLIILFFVVAWRAPDPPLPEYGIELNFGTDDRGSGNVQPKEPVGKIQPQQQEEAKAEPEESKPAAAEEAETARPEPAVTEPAEEQVTSKVESPVVVKEEKKEEAKPVEKPAEKAVEKKIEAKTEVKPKETPKAVYTPKTSKNDAPAEKTGKAGSQGDDMSKEGDKGSPEGKLDANALYGKPGGGAGGSSLDLSGWEWDSRPSPNVPDNELGGIVKFQIQVDANGDIRSIKTMERSVSPETERICRAAVEKLTFTKTGVNVPDISTGTITFVVRSK
jgi:periplasmic protein TonB